MAFRVLDIVKKDDMIPDLLVLPPGTDLHNHPLVINGECIYAGMTSFSFSLVHYNFFGSSTCCFSHFRFQISGHRNRKCLNTELSVLIADCLILLIICREVILNLGSSRTVIEFLCATKEKKRSFQVFVAEGANVNVVKHI
ncbi:hypothetical protein CTI12_AA624440 [Artemisia annua]|uniref:NOL1/NOP2/NSUN 5/7 ferredoxin-like domain-containing protein n=1 Tax=Artemisia annua TaxID=35608 RepID=A0A2U1KAU8_ARTAN|nr:hypothetical protein CTI12_AA624440 [Artemisia annua]